jgi:hypothetical protein
MPELSRRRALTAAAALATVAGVQSIAAPSASTTGHDDHHSPTPFDEVYKGRRIQGGPSHGGSHGGGHHGGHGGGYTVRIDGEELHVMRNADGTWISVVNHYEPQATPRALARAAVVELQGAALVPLALT